MKWKKRGLIYGPDDHSGWRCHSALQPTPFLLSDTLIRVFVGFRDEEGVSRVGFVDLDARDPVKFSGYQANLSLTLVPWECSTKMA